MIAFVTGANGFVGRRLVEILHARDIRIRAFVLPGEEVPERWSALEVAVVRGDVTDRSALVRAGEGVDVVMHLAALVADWGRDDLHERVTVEGTRHALEAASRSGARFVLCSSVCVYGDRMRRGRCTEDTPLGRAAGPYGRAKQEQERETRAYAERGLRIGIVRPTNVYGPGSQPWVRDAIVQLRGGVPSLLDGGRGRAGLVHVDHVADLLARAGVDEAAIGRTYNACDELDVTWRDYFADLARIAGTRPPRSFPSTVARALARPIDIAWAALGLRMRPPLTSEAVQLVSSDFDVPSERARTELGWTRTVRYEDAIAAIAEELRASSGDESRRRIPAAPARASAARRADAGPLR